MDASRPYDWMIGVLDDLDQFATENGLTLTAGSLRTTISTVRDELREKGHERGSPNRRPHSSQPRSVLRLVN